MLFYIEHIYVYIDKYVVISWNMDRGHLRPKNAYS